jgi:hypothetical protein
MNETTEDGAAAPPRIASRADFSAALRWGFEAAMSADARHILCVDRDFEHWPLDDVELHAALTAWLRRPQRRLTLLAGQFDEVPRRHPRFVVWRRAWAHAITTMAAPEEFADSLPTLLVDDGAVLVQLFDAQHWRGRAERDARTARLRRDELDVILQRSSASFPVNTLGL